MGPYSQLLKRMRWGILFRSTYTTYGDSIPKGKKNKTKISIQCLLGLTEFLVNICNKIVLPILISFLQRLLYTDLHQSTQYSTHDAVSMAMFAKLALDKMLSL